MRPYMSLLTVVLVAVFALPLKAQKFAYVESQRILNEYQEYQDVQKQLEQLRSKYDAEYQQMVKEYNALLEEIDSQSLLLSPEKKQQKMQAAQYKYEKLGPEGEFYKKSMELTRPIIDKINKLIAKIGEEEGYDFIFDASSGALVHALPKYDITDRIIEELNKGVSTTKK